MHYQTHYSQVSNEIDNNRAFDKSRPNSLERLLRTLSQEEVKLAARTAGYLKTIIMMSAIERLTDHERGNTLVPVLCLFLFSFFTTISLHDHSLSSAFLLRIYKKIHLNIFSPNVFQGGEGKDSYPPNIH